MRKRPGRPAVRHAPQAAPASAQRSVNDSYQNVAARLGIGTENQSSGAHYGFNPVTRARQELDYMYRGSWIVGQAVDCVAEDMTRAGIDITSDIKPDDIAKIQKGFERRQIWQRLSDTVKWSRLYGGAMAVILIEGQDVSTQLRPETVTKGQFKGLMVLDRWLVQPSFSETVTEFGPDMGKPKFYNVVVDAPALAHKKIHYSRVIRIDGVDLPWWQKIAEQGWGMSVIERLFDRLVAFDSTTTGAAQLVYKAHLRTMSVENLRQILAAGGPAEAALIKQFEMIRSMQTVEGLTLIDAKDTFATHTYTFAGLSDVLLQFAQQLSGALQIPLVRLFGQSPAGLNATGDSDIRNYYDLILQQQEGRLRDGIERLLGIIYRSDIGQEPPEDLSFTFNSLWQMSETEKSTIAVGVTSAVVQAYDAGLVSKPAALKELRQSADVTGIWSNVTDEDIKDAENEPPPSELAMVDPTKQIPGAEEPKPEVEPKPEAA